MKNSETCQQGFFLSVKPYREGDGLAWYILEDETKKHFVLRSVFKAQSKSKSWIIPFTLYQVRYREGRSDLYRPLEITALTTYQTIHLDPHRLLVGQVFLELVHMDLQLDGFSLLKGAFELLNQKELDPDKVLLAFFVEVTLQTGFGPQVDLAINTGQLRVNDFSIEEGGLIYRPGPLTYNLEQLKQIRYIYKAGFRHFSYYQVADLQPWCWRLVLDYFTYHLDIKLKSLALLAKVDHGGMYV